jgi:hypothetical protein
MTAPICSRQRSSHNLTRPQTHANPTKTVPGPTEPVSMQRRSVASVKSRRSLLTSTRQHGAT